MHLPQPTLADNLLQHLAREESLLRDALANVTALHGALRRGEMAEALRLSTEQAALGSALHDAAADRAAAASKLAGQAGIDSKDLTLSALAAKLPESPAAALQAARDRLASVGAELSALHTQNANLIAHLRSFFRGVLSGLTPPDAPQRYGPSGSRLEPAGGAIQTHG